MKTRVKYYVLFEVKNLSATSMRSII